MNEIAGLIRNLKNQGISLNVLENDLEVSLFKDNIDEKIFDIIRENKEGIKEYLKSLNLDFNHVEIPAVALSDSYPISDAQSRLWIMSQMEEDSIVYNLPKAINLEEDINIEHFKSAVNATIERHEILRTVFKEEEDTGEVRQWILKAADFGFEIVYKNFKDKHEVVQAYLDEDAAKPFDLVNGPLLRAALLQIKENEYVFYYCMHHIISDDWSREVMSRDVFAYYKGFKEGRNPDLIDLRIQYKDYSVWQLSQFNEANYKKDKAYWLENLSGDLPIFDFPGVKERPKVKTSNGRRLIMYIEPELSQDLRKFSKENGGSLFMGLLAVWNVLINRYTSQHDIIIGTPTAGREHGNLDDQIGFYVNTLALRNKIKPDESFKSFYNSLKDNTLKSYSHQLYPFDRLVEELELQRETSRSVVFDMMLTLHNVGEHGEGTKRKEEEFKQINDLGNIASKFDIEIGIQEEGDYLSFQVIYNTDIYELEMINGLINHYKQLLVQILNNPEKKISEIEFLSADDKKEQLVDFNNTELNYPKGVTIIDLFEEVVAKNPDSIAITFPHELKAMGSEGNVLEEAIVDNELTYKELNEKSNQLADYLQKKYEIKPDDLIGIKQDRNVWMIISILGVLKSGGAYVPIDPEYPQDRIDNIEEDSKCKVCLDEIELNKFKAIQNEYSIGQVKSSVGADNLAYVIYTSGSTGKPKGVLIEHRNLVHSTTARLEVYKEPQVLLFLSSISFDSSVAGIFGTLIQGGQMVLSPTINAENIDRIITVFETKKITQLLTVPSLYKLLLDKISDKPNSLKVVIVAGEECSKKLVELHQDAKHLANCELYNEYGPTECAVWASFIRYKKGEAFNATIGKPIPNVQIHLLDDDLKLQPKGVIGEICIGGEGVARGYLNRAELTNQKFVKNPFKEGERLYKTGDIGRWTSDGDVAFIGRKDDQVKIRGHRIQLSEIEHALLSNELIEEAVVLLKENNEKEKELVGFFTTKGQQKNSTDEKINTSDLKSYLKELLPQYMLPSYFVSLVAMPLNANGKIDKIVLAKLENEKLSTGEESVAPRNAIEQKLVEIWEEVLGIENIGVKEDFFALGGHSLSAIRVISKIQKEYDTKFEVAKLFEENTIEKIAEFMALILVDNSPQDEEMDEFTI